MDLALDIRTSLEFWRRVFPDDRMPNNHVTAPAGDLAETKKDVLALAPAWLTREFMEPYLGVIHAYAKGDHGSRASKAHRTHKLPTGIPAAAFYRLNSGAYVASPELVFLEAARFLDIAQLIALGDELCGTYSFDEAAPRGFRNRRKPLTNRKRLRAFLEQSGKSQGMKHALQALPFIVERAASPMETFCEMLICLPYRLGGYGLRQPTMNQAIPLTPAAVRIVGQDTCYGDLSWLDANLIVEYQGEYDHGKGGRALSDRARTNALKIMGYDVIELTSNQVNDITGFENIALYIAQKLGRKVKSHALGGSKKHLTLRRTLVAWNTSSGHIA